MSNTYTLLEKITVGAAGASSVTFTSIPQTYTDLVVKLSTRSSRAGIATAPLRLYPNGSSTNITLRYLQGAGNAVSSSTEAVFNAFIGETDAATATASTFANFEIYIPNYTSSNYKSISVDSVQENNQTVALSQMTAFLWSNTAAITSLEIVDGLASFVQHSTFYLYGIAKLGVTPTSAPKATGGDIIKTDGTYWIHTFLSSGTFRPLTSLNCDVLVVAGGGGATNGNAEASGGGGGGGFVEQTGRTAVYNTSYTVTVGAGGTGAIISSGMPTQGGNSVFDTITANGGGASRSESLSPTSLRNGGSGGGGGGNGGGVGAGTATQGNSGGGTGYGNNGGTGYSSNPYTGGGGGGAGAVGSNATSGGGGNGGNGRASSISGSSVTYAGGGGGGNYSSGGVGTATTGGTGGGGNGGKTTSTTVNNQPTAGTANSGGGAGGGQGSSEFKNGGSGIVIVRYPV